MIDITMTATLRPEILDATLSSFKTNLFRNYPCHLIINIDPVGDTTKTADDVLTVAEKYFKIITARKAATASFGHAFKWCWSKVQSMWAFHLEDDWLLKTPVDLEYLLGIMRDNPRLASLRLPMFPAGREEMKNWNLYFPWNGQYFECPLRHTQAAGFAGHPSLLRGSFVRACAPLLIPELNPEKQFHGDNPNLVCNVLQWRYGVYGYPDSPQMIQDIGRDWMQKQGLQKQGNKAFFTQWENAK